MRKPREDQRQYLIRNKWECDASGRLWRHATLGPVTGMPLFKCEARKAQLEQDRREVAQ
jgi:hypothetical protein